MPLLLLGVGGGGCRITFLASEEASYITGTVLPVAGGDLG